MHSTGDGQVPMNQAQMLRERVRSAGEQEQLVQRVITDASHCGFTTSEQEAGLAALIRWVEHRQKPHGTNLAVRDLTKLAPTFELLPVPEHPRRHASPEQSSGSISAAMPPWTAQRSTLDGSAQTFARTGWSRHVGSRCHRSTPGGTRSRSLATPRPRAAAGRARRSCSGRSSARNGSSAPIRVPWPARGAATFDADVLDTRLRKARNRRRPSSPVRSTGAMVDASHRVRGRSLRRPDPLWRRVGEAHRQLLRLHLERGRPVQRGRLSLRCTP